MGLAVPIAGFLLGSLVPFLAGEPSWTAVFDQPCDGAPVCSYLFEAVARDGAVLGRLAVETEGCGERSFDVTGLIPLVHPFETSPPRLQVYSVSCEGVPSATCDWVLLDPDPACAGQTRKSHDGDVNRDGVADISDAIALANYLFLGARRPCSNAADTNDDGRVDLGDAVYILQKLFAAGS
ncbi:MAG: dockerin type I repeat-containing protein [Planctomycetota bacterium]